jgi:hypothetical protein
VTRVRALAGLLLLGAALTTALPAAEAQTGTGNEADPVLRVRGGRVGERVVFRIGVRAPVLPNGDAAKLHLRSTRPLRWRCRGAGCAAPGASARTFEVPLEGPGRVLVTAAAGTGEAVLLEASVVAGETTLARAARRAEPAEQAAILPAKVDGGSTTTIVLGLGAVIAAALAVFAGRRVGHRDERGRHAVPKPSRAPAPGPALPEAPPAQHDGNLWELAAAARAQPPSDPREAARLEALLFELREHAELDGRLPGHLAALVRDRGTPSG